MSFQTPHDKSRGDKKEPPPTLGWTNKLFGSLLGRTPKPSTESSSNDEPIIANGIAPRPSLEGVEQRTPFAAQAESLTSSKRTLPYPSSMIGSAAPPSRTTAPSPWRRNEASHNSTVHTSLAIVPNPTTAKSITSAVESLSSSGWKAASAPPNLALSTTRRPSGSTAPYRPNNSFLLIDPSSDFVAKSQRYNNDRERTRAAMQQALQDHFRYVSESGALQSIIPTSGPHFRKPQVLTYHSRRAILTSGNKRMRTDGQDNEDDGDNNEENRNMHRRRVHYDDGDSSSITHARMVTAAASSSDQKASSGSAYHAAMIKKTMASHNTGEDDVMGAASSGPASLSLLPEIVVDCSHGGPYRFAPPIPMMVKTTGSLLPSDPIRSFPTNPPRLFAHPNSDLDRWFEDRIDHDEERVVAVKRKSDSGPVDFNTDVESDRKKPKGEEEWTCSHCNTKNKGVEWTCLNCKERRSVKPSTSTWGSTFDQLNQFKKGKWKCDSCGLWSPNEQQKCVACETPRPQDQSTANNQTSNSTLLFSPTPAAAFSKAPQGSSTGAVTTQPGAIVPSRGFLFTGGQVSGAGTTHDAQGTVAGQIGNTGFSFGVAPAPTFGISGPLVPGGATLTTAASSTETSVGTSRSFHGNNQVETLDSQLTREKSRSPNNRKYTLYVLKLKDDKYYVGVTGNKERRYEEHRNGRGSAWTKAHPMVGVLTELEVSDRFEEDKYVKKYMDKFGIDNVRGGSYSNLQLDAQQRQSLELELNHALDRCLNCGQSGHYIANCPMPGASHAGRNRSCRGRTEDGKPCMNSNDLSPDGFCPRHRGQTLQTAPCRPLDDSRPVVAATPTAGPETTGYGALFGSGQSKAEGQRAPSLHTKLPNGDGGSSGVAFPPPSASLSSVELFRGARPLGDAPIEQQEGKRVKRPNEELTAYDARRQEAGRPLLGAETVLSTPSLQAGSSREEQPALPFSTTTVPSFPFGSAPTFSTTEASKPLAPAFSFGGSSASTNEKTTLAPSVPFVFPIPAEPTTALPVRSDSGVPSGQFVFGSGAATNKGLSEPAPAPTSAPPIAFGSSSMIGAPTFGSTATPSAASGFTGSTLFGSSTNSTSSATNTGFAVAAAPPPPLFGSSSSGTPSFVPGQSNSQSLATSGGGFSFGSASTGGPVTSNGPQFGQSGTSVPSFGSSSGFSFGAALTPVPSFGLSSRDATVGASGAMLGENGGLPQPAASIAPSFGFAVAGPPSGAPFGGQLDQNNSFGGFAPATFGGVPSAGGAPPGGFQVGTGGSASGIVRRRVVRAKRPGRA